MRVHSMRLFAVYFLYSVPFVYQVLQGITYFVKTRPIFGGNHPTAFHNFVSVQIFVTFCVSNMNKRIISSQFGGTVFRFLKYKSLRELCDKCRTPRHFIVWQLRKRKYFPHGNTKSPHIRFSWKLHITQGFNSQPSPRQRFLLLIA